MGKMKELAIEGRNTENHRQVKNLAEAALRLCTEVDRLFATSAQSDQAAAGIKYALSDLKGEARDMLKRLG